MSCFTSASRGGPADSRTADATFRAFSPFGPTPTPPTKSPTLPQRKRESSLNIDFLRDMSRSPPPFIKDEPEDMHFNNRFTGQNGFDGAHSFGGQPFGTSQNEAGSVNPSDLSMSGSFMNGHFGSNNHMSSSFIAGNSNITNDELLELGNLDDPHGQPGFVEQNGFNSNPHVDQNQPGYFQQDSINGGPVSMAPSNSMNQVYSHTPEGGPMHSPFANDFNNYQQFRMPSQGGYPHQISASAGMPNGFARPKITAMDRQHSDSRSPMTPKTPGMGNLHISTPDSGSFPGQQMMGVHMGHRHQKSLSSQWDNTPNSAQSWVDSPMASPHTGSMHHPQISEVLTSGKHASLPAKVDGDGPPAGYQSQEAKRRRRRESHNLVERRRRDNINERIQDLSRLVPHHRLEDEKVRKHINNNGPLSPTITATSVSPPQGAATSLLAGGNGRRAAGTITQGLPLEEKDKGPNKGDILNGAVSWTRDLMWMLHLKLEQEAELRDYIHQLGGSYPFEIGEDEKRMQTEVYDAVQKNDSNSFSYSRCQGSGLRVPKHTTLSGEPLPTQNISPESLSPSGASNTNSNNQGQPVWINRSNGNSGGPDAFNFKEEDEYTMEM